MCVELACMTLGQAVDSTLVARFSGVSEKVGGLWAAMRSTLPKTACLHSALLDAG